MTAHLSILGWVLFTAVSLLPVVAQSTQSGGTATAEGARLRSNPASSKVGESIDAVAIHLEVGRPQLVTVSMPVPGREKRAVRAVRTSCECARLVAHDPDLDPKRPFDALLRVAPTQAGHFRYVVDVEAEGGTKVSRSLDVIAVSPPTEEGGTVAPAQGEPPVKRPAVQWAETISGDVQVVDVRPARRFALGHLPGSINLPRYQLRRASAALSRPVVVVGDGHDDEALFGELPRVGGANEGAVRILKGGLSGWIQRGGEISGAGSDPTRLLVLPATELLPLLGHTAVRWLDVGGEAALPEARRLRISGLEAVPASDLAQTFRTTPENVPGPQVLVLCGAPREQDAVLSAALSSQTKLAVFAVDGGLRALEAELDRTMRVAGKRMVRLVGGAGSEAPRSAAQGRSGGCCGRSGN
jgi:rhodanese-related sulfurtransferase